MRPATTTSAIVPSNSASAGVRASVRTAIQSPRDRGKTQNARRPAGDHFVEARRRQIFSRHGEFVQQIDRGAQGGIGGQRHRDAGAQHGARDGAAEHRQVRRGAPDERGAAAPHQSQTGRRDADAVDDRRALVESAERVQGLHLAARGGIGAFGAVDQKRVARRRLAEARGQVRFELERVGPGEAAHHAHREIRAEDVALVGIVMADRGHAAQQILQRAPPEAHRFGHAQVLANRDCARDGKCRAPIRRHSDRDRGPVAERG